MGLRPIKGSRTRRYCFRGFLFASSIILVWSNLTALADNQSVDEFSDRRSGPIVRSGSVAIGNMNGIKLSIPYYYLNSGVQYYGQHPLTLLPPIANPTHDTEIEHFAILLRLSNFRPITTTQDREEHYRSGLTANPDYYGTWTTIGFSKVIRRKWYGSQGNARKLGEGPTALGTLHSPGH